MLVEFAVLGHYSSLLHRSSWAQWCGELAGVSSLDFRAKTLSVIGSVFSNRTTSTRPADTVPAVQDSNPGAASRRAEDQRVHVLA